MAFGLCVCCKLDTLQFVWIYKNLYKLSLLHSHLYTCELTVPHSQLENTITKNSTQLYCSLHWSQPFERKKSHFMVRFYEVHLASFENGVYLNLLNCEKRNNKYPLALCFDRNFIVFSERKAHINGRNLSCSSVPANNSIDSLYYFAKLKHVCGIQKNACSHEKVEMV